MYKITIEETKDVRRIVGMQWGPVKKVGDNTEYGYAPEVETLVTQTREIYRQEVNDLDLAAVIIAVNKLLDAQPKK